MTQPAVGAVESLPVSPLGRYSFQQGKRGLRLTTDTVLLARFARREWAAPIIDLGCGYGPIPLLLADAFGDCPITGVEIAPEAAAVAVKNVEMNGLQDRITILNADIRELPGVFPRGSFPIVVSNPPYMKVGSARMSKDRQRAIARFELTCALRDLITTSAHLAGETGRIFFVYTADRFDELLEEARCAGLDPVRVEFVRTAPDKPVKRFLIELKAVMRPCP
ncbi:MAG: methyltransferase domain-containing protein [Deltaproteobacteria bacterium]|nr:methyltransferase domain-containing protein [Deltaproteobacteria bacterium]